MTAKELIAELQKVHPDTQVRVEGKDWDYLRLTTPPTKGILEVYICPYSGDLIIIEEDNNV